MDGERKCQDCGAELAADAESKFCAPCSRRRADDVTAPIDPTYDINIAPPVLRVFGNYELLGEIARGGMGVVYKARQRRLNRIVAVKTLPSGYLAADQAIQRFLTEAEAAANLRHPNIVAVHEAGEQDGQPYFSMDLVDGRNLAQITGGKPLPAERAATYAKKIAEAVHFAHQRGTLHRDLKPSNVLIDENDEPRITDFGLAKIRGHSDGMTHSGTILGTPSYMPPEQATSRLDLIGPQSDVYSTGAILYELLTGRPPFKNEGIHATLLNVASKEPAAPRKVNPLVPADLETVCLKCLEKNPQHRYASAGALAEDLGRFLRREPVIARPASMARKTEQWMKRHMWTLAAAGVLLLAGVMCLSYGLWAQNRFLVWKISNPNFVPAPGPLTRSYEIADLVAIAVNVALLGIFGWLAGRARRQVVQAIARPGTSPVLAPLSSTAMMWIALLGIFGVVYSVYLLVKAIDAFIWEGCSQFATVAVSVYCTLYFGVLLLLLVLRERHRSLFGSDPVVFAATPLETAESVLAALREGDPLRARKIYRDTMQCSAAAAKASVEAIAASNNLPVPPPLISPRRLAIGALASAAAAVALFATLPQAWRGPFLVQVAGGWVLGVAIMAGSRFSRRFRGALAFLPGMLLVRRAFAYAFGAVAVVAAGGYQSRAVPDLSHFEGVTLGIFAAVSLVIFSYKKPPK